MVIKRRISDTGALGRDLITTDPWEGGRLLKANALWFRYYSPHGWFWTWYKRGRRIFCYSRKRMDGKFLSWEYVCQKKGGPLAMRGLAHHKRRRSAKARAATRYETWTRKAYKCRATPRQLSYLSPRRP